MSAVADKRDIAEALREAEAQGLIRYRDYAGEGERPSGYDVPDDAYVPKPAE